MKYLPFWGLGIAAALSFSLPISANANGGSFGSSSGYSGGHSGGSGVSSGSFHSAGSFTHSGGSSGGHMISPFISPSHTSGYHSQVTAPRIYSNVRTSPEGVIKTPTFAFGGRPVNSTAAQNAQRSNGSHTRPTGGWDRNWDRIWHGHHYHWNNGAWVIINDGNYPWGDSYYEPSSPDVYPDMSYDYDNGNTNTAIVPAPAPVPAQPEDSIAGDVQQALQARGYYHGELDGIIGDTTRSAIVDFQKDNDLPITGYITKSLLRALGL